MVQRAKTSALRSVSDTALLVAYHRAMESKRPDALFHDDIAVRLSQGSGGEVARSLFYGRSMAWTTIVRTVLLDEIILRLTAAGVDTVINLAAGLDGRPFRLPLPPSVRWIEVDMPDMISQKQAALASNAPVCRLERVPLDLSLSLQRRELVARLGAKARNALVVSEGLLMYLSPETVGELADELHAQATFRYWATDLAPPMVKKRVNRWWGRKLKQAGTQYQFAPEEGTKFFVPHGWRETEFHSLFDHAVRLHRTMRGYWIIRLMQRVAPRRTARSLEEWRAGVVLLERT